MVLFTMTVDAANVCQLSLNILCKTLIVWERDSLAVIAMDCLTPKMQCFTYSLMHVKPKF